MYRNCNGVINWSKRVFSSLDHPILIISVSYLSKECGLRVKNVPGTIEILGKRHLQCMFLSVCKMSLPCWKFSFGYGVKLLNSKIDKMRPNKINETIFLDIFLFLWGGGGMLHKLIVASQQQGLKDIQPLSPFGVT